MNTRILWLGILAFVFVGAFCLTHAVLPGRSGTAWADPDQKKDEDKDEEDDPIVKIMKGFKANGRSISQGFKLSDKDRILEGAGAIVKAAGGLGALYPVKDDKEGSKDFSAKVDALVKGGTDFVARAQKAKTDAKSIAALREDYMDKVRPACAACHSAYIVTFKCETKGKTWTQPKWEEKHCPICGKKGCGIKVDNEDDD